MVRIVNWLITRRCNLSCEYCGIIKNGGKKYIENINKNEMSTNRVIALLDKFIKYNPKIFHIFYGGEPFLRRDLSDILKFCNEKEIDYTIISNCTLDIQPRILKVMNECGGFRGFTGSVDPSILMEPEGTSPSQLKSAAAYRFLMNMREHVKDVVAEITMTKETLDQTYNLVKLLSSAGIYSSITAIDINKTYMYDFSAYSAKSHLIKDSKKLAELYMQLAEDDNLLIHMKDIILPRLFANIDSTYDCGMGIDSVHNLTIDADGRLRTCLRMKGNFMREITDQTLLPMFPPYAYELNSRVFEAMQSDRTVYCKGCNHTCVMMSKYIDRIDDSSIIINHEEEI